MKEVGLKKLALHNPVMCFFSQIWIISQIHLLLLLAEVASSTSEAFSILNSSLRMCRLKSSHRSWIHGSKTGLSTEGDHRKWCEQENQVRVLLWKINSLFKKGHSHMFNNHLKSIPSSNYSALNRSSDTMIQHLGHLGLGCQSTNMLLYITTEEWIKFCKFIIRIRLLQRVSYQKFCHLRKNTFVNISSPKVSTDNEMSLKRLNTY